MKNKNGMRFLALAGLVGMSACGMKVQSTNNGHSVVDVTEGFPSYAGTFTSHAEALSQGYTTECDSDLEVTQTPTALTVKQLSYSCNDGTTWGFNQAMTFELRKPTEVRQLAYDIYYNGTYAGFLNYSNSYAYIALNQNGGAFTLALAQDKAGRRLEDFSVSSSSWTLFDAKPSALTKK